MSDLADRLARGLDTALDRSVAPGFTALGYAVRRRLPTWPADPEPGSLTGRVAAVTGATSGLGLATAEGLARLGAQVRLVVRNPEKAAGVREQILERVPGAEIAIDRCDSADLDDVRRFAAHLPVERVDVLVHNAGALPPERTESAQGFEMTMALHVLGPVLTTELLRPRMAGRDARVVFVTSGGMYAQRLRADDPGYRDGTYSGTTAYARSKRAQVELLPVLEGRWSPDGIHAHAMHPGWAETPGLAESLPGFSRLTRPFLRDLDEGADTSVWLAATRPPPPGGRLWHDRRPRPTHMRAGTRTGHAERQQLWDWVRAELGLDD